MIQHYTRRTVAGDVKFEGKGLHGGEPVKVTLHPAEGKVGIVFRHGADRFAALPQNVSDTTRSTRLVSVGTVEHLMSALAGLGITDVEVEVEGPELPALDGSAKVYVDAILEVGFAGLGEAEITPPYRRIFFQQDAVKIAIGAGNGHWRFEYDPGTETTPRWPGLQTFETNAPPIGATDEKDEESACAEDPQGLTSLQRFYVDEIAPARTFALNEELGMIIQHGLAKGLDSDSAVILGIEGYKNEVRFPDEPARHKLLDMIGDIALAGVPMCVLNVVGHRSGHRTHVEAASLLYRALHD